MLTIGRESFLKSGYGKPTTKLENSLCEIWVAVSVGSGREGQVVEMDVRLKNHKKK